MAFSKTLELTSLHTPLSAVTEEWEWEEACTGATEGCTEATDQECMACMEGPAKAAGWTDCSSTCSS